MKPNRPVVASEDARPSKLVHVLLVEDSADAAEGLELLLSVNGYHVLTASTGENALAGLAKFKPDIAILDIHLPGLDGCGVASLVRRSPVMKGVPLIAVSGYTPEQVAQKFSPPDQFDHYLIKPADPVLLLALLQTVMVKN